MLNLTIVSPEKKVIDNVPVSQVTLFSAEGQIQILPGHARMVGVLDAGAFNYTTESGELSEGVISFGFYEVTKNQNSEHLHVMAQTIERKSEIDAKRAKSAQEKAQSKLSEEGLSEENFNKYQLKLQRALIRQQIVSKETH